MFLIKYYQDNDTVPIPKVRDIKETKYKDVDMLEYDIYFDDVFAYKDVVVIGVNYISYNVNEKSIERFSFLTPHGLLDNTFYPVPAGFRKLVRDNIKRNDG